MNTSQRIQDLTAKWYEAVSYDHHKDRDCHWYIEVDYAYGQAPTFMAQHHGYVFQNVSGPVRSTYAEAEADLVDLIIEAFRSQERWANEVMTDLDGYDAAEIEQAKTYLTVLNEIKEPTA